MDPRASALDPQRRMELDRRLAASGLDLDALDPRLRSHLELRASHPEARLGVGRYLLTDELGRGGMGVVYEGWDPVIGRRVAIKTLELHLVAEEEREEVVERFRRETRIVGKLDHPGIVTIYDSGVEQWRRESRRADEPETIFYYVMERLEGRSLSDELRERAPLDPLRAVRVARSLAEVLDRAHDEGIIHRDIKPSNVFLRDEGGAVLLDFGIATAGTGVLTQQGQILGTPSYLAPERLHEKETPIDGRADQFSLGVLLFTMLAGKPPFVGKDMYDVIDKITKDDPPALDERSPGGQSLSRIVEQLLAKDPEQRFATAGAAAEALAQVEAELSAERASPARPAPEVAARAVQPAGTPVVPSTDLSGLEGEATAIGLPPEVTQEGLTLGEEGTTGDLSTDPEVSSAGDAAPSPRDEAAPAAPGPLSLWPGDDTAAEATVADMADEATGTDSDARRGPRFEVSLVETDDVMVRPLRDSEISDEELVTQAATAVHQAGAGERPRREPEPRRPTPLHLEPETPSEPEAPQRRAREKKKSAAPRMDVRVRESSSRWRWLDDRKPLLIAGLLLSVGVGLALGRMGRRASSPEGSVADESPVAVVAAERRTSKPQHPHGRALLSDAEAARTSGELERAEALYARAAEAAAADLALKARAYLGRADVLRAAGREPDAVEAYRAVLALEVDGPERGQARVALGELGIRPRERTARRRAAAPPPLKPRAPPAQKSAEDACRELLFRHARAPEAAVRGFEALAERHPRAPCVRWNLGVKYERVGRIDDAVGAYLRYLELDPESGRREAVLRRIRSLESR